MKIVYIIIGRKNNDIRYNVDKYPELIKNKGELRIAFLNEFVKDRIEEMLKVDVFVGFPYQLIMMRDNFEFEAQQVLYRAIAIKEVGTYSKIKEFLAALNEYNSYLSSIGEFANKYVIRVINRKMRENHEAHEAVIDILRNDLIKILNEINV